MAECKAEQGRKDTPLLTRGAGGNDDHSFTVRERLNSRLRTTTRNPITVVLAPAGFGKTTAIKNFLSTRQDSLFVRTPDSCSLRQFIGEFARCCLAHFPAMAKSIPEETPLEDDDADEAIGIYIAWAVAHIKNSGTRWLIAVDDIQNADDHPAVSSFLTRLADESKNIVSWILSTRKRGLLPVTRWQAYGDADAIITADDLRMTYDEVVQLANTVGSMATENQLKRWLSETSGFIIPLAFAIRHSAYSEIDDIRSGARKLTFAFLAEQIWASLTGQDRALLEVAALIPDIHIHHIENAGIAGASSSLSRLCSEIAFLSITPEGTFAMQDLFRDFVRAQILLEGPDVLTERRQHAVRALQQAGRNGDSVRLLLDAKDLRSLSDVIENGASQIEDQELVKLVVEAFSSTNLKELGLQSLALHLKHWNWLGDTKKTQLFAYEILSRAGATSSQILLALYAVCAVINRQTEAEWSQWLETVSIYFDQLDHHDKIIVSAYRATVLSRLGPARNEAKQLILSVENSLTELLPVERISVEAALSNATYWLGDRALAQHFAREAVHTADTIGDLRERARALDRLGVLLMGSHDSEIETLFEPLRDAVERSGSWRYSHVSHWFPAIYYALKGDIDAMSHARKLQYGIHPIEDEQRRMLHLIRQNTENLEAILTENYSAVIADHLSSNPGHQTFARYELLIDAACACSLIGQHNESEMILSQARRAEKIYHDNRDYVYLEIICLGANERWMQARRLLDQIRGTTPALLPAENALTIFCDGPPFSGLADALMSCFGKPYLGFFAILMKRVADRCVPNAIKLTRAESDVLRLLSLGKSNKLIAEDRERSAETIKRQVAAIYRKLGVENRTTALAIARERGLL